jgi:hypothetical protein
LLQRVLIWQMRTTARSACVGQYDVEAGGLPGKALVKCILAFVEKWQGATGLARHPDDLISKSLLIPDARAMPVCVVEAPGAIATPTEASELFYPTGAPPKSARGLKSRRR